MDLHRIVVAIVTTMVDDYTKIPEADILDQATVLTIPMMQAVIATVIVEMIEDMSLGTDTEGQRAVTVVGIRKVVVDMVEARTVEA